jgi:hypothetical protein
MCSSTLSLTSTLDGVGGQRHASVALSPRNTRYPLYRRLGGPRDLRPLACWDLGSSPSGTMDVCRLSGRGLGDKLITRTEESYRLVLKFHSLSASLKVHTHYADVTWDHVSPGGNAWSVNIYSYIFNMSVYIGLTWRGKAWADALWCSTPYDAFDTNQNAHIFVRRVKACEESSVNVFVHFVVLCILWTWRRN